MVQEVFPDGVIAQDGRLQSGDQIIEVDGVDMTSATHSHVCQLLKTFTQYTARTLRLGVYRERIQPPTSNSSSPSRNDNASTDSLNSTGKFITKWEVIGKLVSLKICNVVSYL